MEKNKVNKFSVYFYIFIKKKIKKKKGMIGSTHDAETNQQEYNDTLIAYLNVDMGVTFNNPKLQVKSSPILRTIIRDCTKIVTDPNTGLPLFDVWDGQVGLLQGGSDYVTFVNHVGISSADFSFGIDRGYGVYHSRYDR